MREELRIARIEKQKEQELTQSKLRYFTNVSHDFLTPITIISCAIDDMQITTPTDRGQLQAGLDRIRVNLVKLKQLIQQVLDFRKVENGQMHLEVTEANLVEFVRNLCNDAFLPVMQKKGLDLQFAAPLTPIMAYFDGDKLEKIISNLLSNAYKYTERGKITVALEQQGRVAIIKVKDTGRGIAKKDLEHIFERFYTVNEQRNDSNGIGLSLVKELVALHHAEIKINSVVGEGTVFTIALPIDKESYSDAEMADVQNEANSLELQLPQGLTPEEVVRKEKENHNLETEKVRLESNQFSNDLSNADDKRLLIVEDNADLRDLMVRIFARYHQVESAANGQEALDIICDNEPDIIISDVMMPVMDGLELCRKLKTDINTSHIPLILLTARNTPEDRVECYEAGADGYIAKPFELPVLKARVDNFLRVRKERQERFRTSLVAQQNGARNDAELLHGTHGRQEMEEISSNLQGDVVIEKREPTALAGGVANDKPRGKGEKDEWSANGVGGFSCGLEKLNLSSLDKKALDKALALIEEHLDDDTFDVGQMADAMFMSKTSLYRKIKSLTGLSPVEFIRNIRLKRAYQMLQQDDVTISDVAYACGFSTQRYFSTCFKTEFGITPTELKRQ